MNEINTRLGRIRRNIVDSPEPWVDLVDYRALLADAEQMRDVLREYGRALLECERLQECVSAEEEAAGEFGSASADLLREADVASREESRSRYELEMVAVALAQETEEEATRG